MGLGATSANYILNVVGNGYVSTSLTVGTSLSVLGNTTLAANLSVGGSFLSVGTSNLVTNLNADLLDGKHSTSYLQVGGTGFFNTATNGLQMIGATAVGLGGTLTQLTKIDQNNFNFSFFGSGNVGIGTTSPGSKLHVVQSGTGRGDGIILSASGNNWYQFVDQSDAFNIFYNSGQKLTINGTGIGIGITNPTYKLHVVGDAYITTSLTVGTSLSVLGNLTVGGTSYTGDLNINKPNSVGGSYVAAFVGTGTTGFLGYVDTTNWDKSTSDDYAYWVAKVGNTVSNISTGNTLTFTAGTGIGMTFAGNNITINSVGGIGTTYAAGIGLTLSDTNVFALNLGYTNAWLAPQYFTNGIGVTGNSTFQNNLTIGGTFISVGSTNLVTNLNANYLGGISSTGFLQIGQTGSLPYVNDATDTTLTRSGTGPYTLALNLGSTNAWTAQQNFIDIGVTGYANFQDDIIVGGAIISVGQTNLVTNLNANYLSGYAYNNLPYFNTASNGLSAINTNTVGLGGTLTQNTIINNSNYNLSFLGLNSEQSLYVSSMGYVGIGTTDPNHNFEVNGSAYFSNSIEVGSSVLVTNLNADMLDGFHSWDFITNITAGVGITIIGAGNTRVIAFDGSQIGNMTFGSGSSFTWTFDSGATTSLINFDNGFIGIGTTSAPRTTLEVNGTVAAQKFVDLTGYEQYFMDLANSDYNSSSLSLDRRGSIKWNATYNSGWKTIDNGVASKIENRANGLLFATSIGTTTAGSTITDWNQSLFIGNSGHVGIGNTNPQSVLELSNSTSTFTSLAGDITFNAGSGNISLNGGKLSNLSAVQTSSGTSLNPSFSFSSDTTTGMFSAGIGTLNLGTGGTTRLTIGNSGFVGIGTASPLGPFQIAIGDTQALFVNSAGLIGIGTTSPGGILHLSSTGDVLSIIAADTDNSGEEDNPRLELRQDDNTVIGGLGFVGSAGQIYTGSLANSMYLVNDFASALQFGTNNTANVTILSDGNVGIGTTSPISTLHVNETSTLGTSIGDTSVLTRLQQSNGNANYLDITQRRHTAGADWAGTNVRIQRTIDTTKMGFIDFGVNGSSSNYGLGLGVNASTFLTIAANGSVGIGTTSPSGLLHVEGSSTSGLVFIKNLQTGYTAAALTIQNMSTSIGITGGEFVRFLNSSGTKVGRIRTNVLASSVAYSLSGTADFAEYVIASEPTEAGDLIAFSDNKYIKASSDNSLAGIHSFDPSFVGNENIADQPNALPLALSGIVKLKVSSINGPINPGDSLTASSIKGIASKAISAGYIAAKAIDSYNSSDPNQVGLINVIVNLGWYDPDVFITENGQVAVNYNVSPEVLASLGYSDTKNEIETASYSLTDSTDKIITKIGLFAQISAAKINTGLLSAKNIIVDNLAAKKIASETIITGNITATTAEISDLTANQITANEASFSSIYADQIINPEGNISDVFAAKITALRDEIKTIIAENQATPSALLADSTTWDTSVSTDSADLTLDNLTLSNDLIIGAQLTVQGLSKFTSANVSDIFTVGQIALQDNILETTSENLYIQPSGLGTIHFLNDRLVLSSDGNVTINGNLNINGSLIANLLKADNIETKNLTAEKINIATSSAIIADSSLASLATSSAQLSTNATVGTITLAAGQTEITIQNNQLTSTSMVYLTPTSSTQNQVPYLKSKDQDTFTIAIDQALNDNVNINWWLIN
ncbi:MAG: Cell wall surface anchor family protein [Candidatus Shapirobacteria bacterium GW2011_GWF2_37_20]|nr:MAG: Cell wall surface anchor family protein [Candidatus Shapirobacteria bacterium GW2011_GWF2_37_20]